MNASAKQFGQKRLRLAILFSAAGVLTQGLLVFVPGCLHGSWQGEEGGVFVLGSILFAVSFTLAFIILWVGAFRLSMLISGFFHFLFGRKIPSEVWQSATCRALWPFPYAFGLGAITYVIYYFFSFGGWPSDVIFGAIGNILGAWCYLTIIIYWRKLIRSKNETSHCSSGAPGHAQ